MHSVLNEDIGFLTAFQSMMDDAAKSREKNKNTYMYGSISRYTQKLVLSFPVIADNTVPISTAQMISKAHEKNLATMFEMMLTAMSLQGNNGIEILKSLHQNLSNNASIDDIIDAIEKAVGESTELTPVQRREIIEEMCNYLKHGQKVLPIDSFSETSLNDYLVRENYNGVYVLEAPNNKTYTKQDVDDAYERGKSDKSNELAVKKDQREQEKHDRETRDYEGTSTSAKEEERRRERYADIAREERRRRDDQRREDDRRKEDRDDRREKEETRKREREEDYYERLYDKQDREKERKEDIERRKQEREEDAKRKDYETELKLAQSRVKDIDYKKANELQPTLMTVTFTTVDTDGNPTGDKKSFNAGIKSRLVGSDSMEIVERLTSSIKNKLTFKDLIRATTGEISLVKDFIAATKQAKINARNAANRGETAKMWNLLAARSKKNKVTGTGMRSNEAAAITSLIINQETANYIANQYKINLESPKDAARIMNDFNLLCFIIADEANEVAKFLYDGNNSFEMLAYSSLSKDQRDDKSYNKAINLLNKNGR